MRATPDVPGQLPILHFLARQDHPPDARTRTDSCGHAQPAGDLRRQEQGHGLPTKKEPGQARALECHWTERLLALHSHRDVRVGCLRGRFGEVDLTESDAGGGSRGRSRNRDRLRFRCGRRGEVLEVAREDVLG